MLGIFSKEAMNTGRQIELDLSKGIAIIGMIWTHIVIELGDNHQPAQAAVEMIMGGPLAAPLFMICMGVGIGYSRNQEPAYLAKRGLQLFGIGFVLNLLRYGIPQVIRYFILGDSQIIDKLLHDMVNVDILQFAGLAFLAIAFFKKLKLKTWNYLLIAIVSSLLGDVLRYQMTGNLWFDQFLGYFWGTVEYSYFPFFNWLVFPLVGLVFAEILKHCQDKERFYRYLLPLSALLVVAYYALTLKYGSMAFSEGEYYYPGLVDAFFFSQVAFLVFSITYLTRETLFKPVTQLFMRYSRQINDMYCIHWILIGFAGIWLSKGSLNLWTGAVCALLFIVLSDWVSQQMQAFRKWRKEKG